MAFVYMERKVSSTHNLCYLFQDHDREEGCYAKYNFSLELRLLIYSQISTGVGAPYTQGYLNTNNGEETSLRQIHVSGSFLRAH